MDDELLAAFEDGTLPREQWNHRAHVCVAYLIACQHELPEAIDRMRAGLQAYNAAQGVPETLERGYHETVTVAFMHLIHAAVRYCGMAPSSDEFCERHPELLDKFCLRYFYSSDRILTREAKVHFVEPDLAPLP